MHVRAPVYAVTGVCLAGLRGCDPRRGSRGSCGIGHHLSWGAACTRLPVAVWDRQTFMLRLCCLRGCTVYGSAEPTEKGQLPCGIMQVTAAVCAG